jgi:guanylate kinase
VINKELNESDQTLAAIVRGERVRRDRMEDQVRPILGTFEERAKD